MSLTLGCNDVHMTYWINGEVQEKLDSIDVAGEECDIQLPGRFDLYHMSCDTRKQVFWSNTNWSAQSQKKARRLEISDLRRREIVLLV